MRIVTLDIETLPIESYHWGMYDETIGLNQVKTDWTIAAIGAKTLGQKAVTYQDTGGRGPKRVRDDGALLRTLWGILDEADIIVGQNVKAFDLKKINARMLQAGLKPYSPVRVVDTRQVAKRHFGFTSNRLEWLSRLTDTRKSDHRKFPGFELWRECLRDNAEAWAEMRRYNIADVLATEELYLKLRPWIDGHPAVAKGRACPKCGGTRLENRGLRRTQGGVYRRLRCHACGGFSHERRSEPERPELGN